MSRARNLAVEAGENWMSRYKFDGIDFGSEELNETAKDWRNWANVRKNYKYFNLLSGAFVTFGDREYEILQLVDNGKPYFKVSRGGKTVFGRMQTPEEFGEYMHKMFPESAVAKYIKPDLVKSADEIAYYRKRHEEWKKREEERERAEREYWEPENMIKRYAELKKYLTTSTHYMEDDFRWYKLYQDSKEEFARLKDKMTKEQIEKAESLV